MEEAIGTFLNTSSSDKQQLCDFWMTTSITL